MNKYFIASILCLGLAVGLLVLSLVYLGGAEIFEGLEIGHPLYVILHGFPVWMICMFLLTLGIFFLIFGFKQKFFLQSQNPR
jgi:hypothetical protein